MRSGTKWKWLLSGAAILAVLLGLLTILSTAAEFQAPIAQDQLMTIWHQSVWKLVLAGALISLGFGTVLVMSLLFNREEKRHQREAEALHRKELAAEALNRQNQQLAHHQRLHIIGTLTSSIAHEFNNLLTPIMGYSMMALEQIPAEDETLYDNLLEIYSASCKAKTIISRLSDLSRKNTDSTFRPVAIDALVHKALDVAAPAKPPDVEVRLNLNCWEQRIDANEIQLSQILLNLILNSFDAMGDAGTLEISTAFDETCVKLTVRDTGCGIPEDVLPHIFEPFFTTKESGKGTGLGLAIVSQMVEDHRGSITVQSGPDEGTAFLVTLPRVRESTDTP